MIAEFKVPEEYRQLVTPDVWRKAGKLAAHRFARDKTGWSGWPEVPHSEKMKLFAEVLVVMEVDD